MNAYVFGSHVHCSQTSPFADQTYLGSTSSNPIDASIFATTVVESGAEHMIYGLSADANKETQPCLSQKEKGMNVACSGIKL